MSGAELAILLRRRYGYRLARQSGSHMTLTRTVGSMSHSVTVPRHRVIRVGTLSRIAADVAAHLSVSPEEVRGELFGSQRQPKPALLNQMHQARYTVTHRNCEAVCMKNITVSVDEETHRRARIRAAELDTSVSALVRAFLRTLAEGDSPRDENGADDDRSESAAQDVAVRRHVQQLYSEAQARAEALAGSPINNVQDLVAFRQRLLRQVTSDFDAQGIGLRRLGVENREEIYDRGRARLEARLAAAEERGEELEGELAALKASFGKTDAPRTAPGLRR